MSNKANKILSDRAGGKHGVRVGKKELFFSLSLRKKIIMESDREIDILVDTNKYF